MSVWLKYAGDKDIPVGKAGSLSISAPVSPGFPAAGTLLSTADDYPLTVANYPSVQTVSVVHNAGTLVSPNQTGDVPIRADGSGGSYYDYTTVTDVKYKTNGTWIDETYELTVLNLSLYVNPVYINISGTNYANGDGYIYVSKHDGSGGYFNEYSTRNYVGYGIPFVINNYYESAGPFGSNIPDGRVNAHWSDFNGSYFTSDGGITTVDGVSVYRSSGGYFPYGTLIGSDEMSTYYWNGTGGYYTG